MRNRSGGFSHSAPRSAASSRAMAAALRRTTLPSFEGGATVSGMVTQGPDGRTAEPLDGGRGIARKWRMNKILRVHTACLLAGVLCCSGSWAASSSAAFEQLVDDFVFGTLAFSPTPAPANAPRGTHTT